MHLREFEGKKLFTKYDIPIPRSILLDEVDSPIDLPGPLVLKSQVASGDRKKKGGILFPSTAHEAKEMLVVLFKAQPIGPNTSPLVLAEERITARNELYVSFSFDTHIRRPVFAAYPKGGTGVAKAYLYPIDLTEELHPYLVRTFLVQARFPVDTIALVTPIVLKLWKLFREEHATLAEINPLFITADGFAIAGDAKITLDDAAQKNALHRITQLDGDIAIIASGGGASLLNIDTLIAHGGKPANYTEYSGNPRSEIVEELTKRVLSREGLRGCWIVGGTANFTDIYETMRGLCAGLLALDPKPSYPIVIRRDGPRMDEARKMLEAFAEEHGFDLTVFGSEISMAESARIMKEKAYAKN